MLIYVSRITLPPLFILAGLIAYRLTTSTEDPPDVVFTTEKPRVIRPLFDDPRIASDDELRLVLERVQPPTGPLQTNRILHALRLWGPEARFNDPNVMSGADLMGYFLDDETFRRYAGKDVPPLFTIRPDGRVIVRSLEIGGKYEMTASHHSDDYMATLVKAGTALDAPIVTRNGTTDFRSHVHTAFHRAHPGQFENEWLMIAYARLVYPQLSWKNVYGKQMHVSGLVDELIDRPLKVGSCSGTHRIEALTLLLRADEQERALPAQTRQKIIDHLTHLSTLLVASQTREGYWTRTWYEGEEADLTDIGSLYDRLLVTGHHLEWLALAPQEVHPPRENIVRAGQWTVRGMLEMDDSTLYSKYGPMTHAVRALCLWRNQEPIEVWEKGVDQTDAR